VTTTEDTAGTASPPPKAPPPPETQAPPEETTPEPAWEMPAFVVADPEDELIPGFGAHKPAAPPALRRTRRRGWRRLGGVLRRTLRPREGKAVFVLTAIPFTAFAVFMSLVRHVAFADALTRINNAEAVIFAFDPHAAAIGFVYGPIPSAVMVPFLPLAKIWPNLQIYNVIGSVMTALFAAGTMAVVVATARELRLPRFARYGLAAAIGLHPIYLVYASNGMAEGINIFFLALTTRYVLRWLDPRVTRDADLLYAGIAVSAAYLTRIEAGASGVAITILVGMAGFLRGRGSLQQRRREGAMCAALVGLPFVFIFTVWAVTCRVIIGKFFPALAGAITGGTKSNLSASIGASLGKAGADYGSLSIRLEYLGKQTLGMAPLVVVALVTMLLFVFARADLRGMVPIATFGASLTVDIVQLLQGASFANLRYFMLVIPLTVYGLMMFATIPSDRLRPRQRLNRRGRQRLGRRYGVLVHLTSLVAVGLAVTTPVAGAALVRNTSLAVQERPWLDAALHGSHAALGADVNTFDQSRAAARYVDGLDTPPGSVLVDAAAASALLAGSKDRNKFLANADRTWEASVADPGSRHVRYLMVSDATGLAGDALDRAYPRLFIEGGGISDKVADFGSWRLYRLRGGALPARPDGADRVPQGGFGK